LSGKIEIINAALSRLGANSIVSLDEGTTEQKLAVNAWDIARRATLRDHPWNFALTDTELNQVADYTPYEFKYAYRLPSDCVRVMQVYGNPTYKRQGQDLLMDLDRCRIKYVKDIVDTTAWDPSFVDLMAQRLAADMAYALSKSQASADSMFGIYDRKLKAARFIDGTEDVQDPIGNYDSAFYGVRF